MGYSTDFMGQLELSRPLTETEKDYINNFSDSRRMARDVNKLMLLFNGKFGHPTPKNDTPEGIYGMEGEYFVNPGTNMGQSKDESIIDFNTPPGLRIDKDLDFESSWKERERRISEGGCQPGLWCQWVIEETINDVDGSVGHILTWDGGEKFYEYDNWLKYLIRHFFEPWGVKLNGSIVWQGEDINDRGKLIVVDNVLTVETLE